MALSIIYATFPDEDSANDIAKTLVKEGKVACANIFKNVTSIYKWKGNVEEDTELVAIFKTSSANVEEVKNRILVLHPYDCPAVWHCDSVGTHADFISWLNESLDSVVK